jgi:predicted peptidase
MTMDMILNYPDYFAAAYPICEAYKDASITDAQLQAIKNVPIWFVYAKNDTTVDPTTNAQPTISRLKAMGANVHASVFDDVHDTTGLYKGEDGLAYQYNGHWSWLYFFNDECASGQTPLWTWMAAQSK